MGKPSERAAMGKATSERTMWKAASERAATGKAATRKAMGKATGKPVRKAAGKAARRRAGETRERECGGRKRGAANGSGGRKNEDGSIQHDKLLLQMFQTLIETIPFRSFNQAREPLREGGGEDLMNEIAKT
jgi:hypothetical protein